MNPFKSIAWGCSIFIWIILILFILIIGVSIYDVFTFQK